MFEFGSLAKLAEGEVDQQVLATFVGDVGPGLWGGGLQDDLKGSFKAAKLGLQVCPGFILHLWGCWQPTPLGAEVHQGLQSGPVVLELVDLEANGGGRSSGAKPGRPKGFRLILITKDDIDAQGDGDGISHLSQQFLRD